MPKKYKEGWTAAKLAEKFELAQGNVTLLARRVLPNKVIEMGKTTLYTEEEVLLMESERSRMLEKKRELKIRNKPFPNGEVRHTATAYNEYLNTKISLNLAHYNYLVATGDWDKGVTRIPSGHVIHHKDLNEQNDSVENLELMTISAHRKLHDSLGTSTRMRNVTKALKDYREKRSKELNLSGTSVLIKLGDIE